MRVLGNDMFAFFYNLILLLAEGEGALSHFYHDYLNIPGFEVWKFINLGVFLAIIAYLVKKPLSEGFKAKREAIRADLIKAEAEKQAALAKLTSVEAKLAQSEEEKTKILAKAKEEADFEKKRIAEHTRLEIARLAEQSENELTRIAHQSRSELRRFSAEESIRLAEEKLRAGIDADKDSRLVKANIQEIGGLN